MERKQKEILSYFRLMHLQAKGKEWKLKSFQRKSLFVYNKHITSFSVELFHTTESKDKVRLCITQSITYFNL